jgi:hypothetical protein
MAQWRNGERRARTAFIFPFPDVSIHARDRATTHGRAYASPVLDYFPEGGGFQPELVFDEQSSPLLITPGVRQAIEICSRMIQNA